MAEHKATAPRMKGAAREVLDYRDLESEMHDAVNMCEVACDQVEAAGRRHGDQWIMTLDEMNLLSFAVYHSSKLVNVLKSRWNEVHESNVAAQSGRGGAA